jgi:Holliday junction resolvasome RuvABC DNA-binding subunit
VTGAGANGNGTTAGPDAVATRTEVRTALASLGYGADEIRLALARLPTEGTVEDQLRLALREMAAIR